MDSISIKVGTFWERKTLPLVCYVNEIKGDNIYYTIICDEHKYNKLLNKSYIDSHYKQSYIDSHYKHRDVFKAWYVPICIIKLREKYVKFKS